MQILISALGSYGDVHPMVGLGRRLQARGHDVTMLVSPAFAPLVARAELAMLPIGTAEDYDRAVRDPDLWHPTRGVQVIARGVIEVGLRETYRLIAQRYRPGETLVVAATLDLGARVAQDHLGVPTVSVDLAPGIFRSVHLSPVLPPARMGPRVPHWLKRLQFALADKWIVDRLLGGPLNTFRRELGLPPVRGVFNQWWHSPTRVIGMFPPWFGPPQVDWPPQVRLADFPRWDESEITSLAEEAAEFLDAGSPPIVFTPGSAMVHGRPFFAAAVEACQRLKRRGLLLTRYPEQIPRELPEGVRHLEFAPLSCVLPRAAALVHHGGVGTLSQALAAGVPHLVMPMTHDQPDNAARLERLGVAESLAPRYFRGPAVAAALDRLLNSPTVAAHCRDYAQRLRNADGLGQACELIEESGRSEVGRRKAEEVEGG